MDGGGGDGEKIGTISLTLALCRSESLTHTPYTIHHTRGVYTGETGTHTLTHTHTCTHYCASSVHERSNKTKDTILGRDELRFPIFSVSFPVIYWSRLNYDLPWGARSLWPMYLPCSGT